MRVFLFYAARLGIALNIAVVPAIPAVVQIHPIGPEAAAPRRQTR